MNPTIWNTALAGIGAILVLALVGTPMIHAEGQTDAILHELKQIEIQLNDLNDFSIEKLGSDAFKLRTIGESLLDIQKSDVDDAHILKITDYLVNEYKAIHEEYLDKVSDYKKQNPFSNSEQLILNELVKNEANFVTLYDFQHEKELEKQFIKSELQRLDNESQFQNLINKIGVKIADEANGNKVQKIQHKLALENIIDTANWKLAPAALDRVIGQVSDEDSKIQMIKNKEKIINLIEKLDEVKQQKPQLYTLTNGYAYVFFGDLLNNENEIHTPHILESQIKGEIYSLAKQTNSIVENNEKKIQEIVIAQRIAAQQNDNQNSITNILEPEPAPEVAPEPEVEPEPQSQPESEPEPEPAPAPEPGNNGNGKGAGNANSNGNDNGNGSSNNNGNGNDSSADSGSENGNGNSNGNSSNNGNGNDATNDKNDNGKGKGKK